jgi:hypothetical protein
MYTSTVTQVFQELVPGGEGALTMKIRNEVTQSDNDSDDDEGKCAFLERGCD